MHLYVYNMKLLLLDLINDGLSVRRFSCHAFFFLLLHINYDNPTPFKSNKNWIYCEQWLLLKSLLQLNHIKCDSITFHLISALCVCVPANEWRFSVFAFHPSGQHIIFFIVTILIVMIILNFLFLFTRPLHNSLIIPFIQFYLFLPSAHLSMQSHRHYWKRYSEWIIAHGTLHTLRKHWTFYTKQWHGYWHKWLHSSFILMTDFFSLHKWHDSYNGFMAKFAKESFTVHPFNIHSHHQQ